ncbi:hypothetical protein ACO0QE_004177 [Hanseniaspora vineae]
MPGTDFSTGKDTTSNKNTNSQKPTTSAQSQNRSSFFRTPMRSMVQTNSAREMHNSLINSRIPQRQTMNAPSTIRGATSVLSNPNANTNTKPKPTYGMLVVDPQQKNLAPADSYTTIHTTMTEEPGSSSSCNETTPHTHEQTTITKNVSRHRCNNPNNPACQHCGSVIIPSPKSSFPVQDTPSITIDERWSIYCSKNPILNAQEIDEWESKLRLPMPEMIFGNNRIVIKHKRDNSRFDDFKIEFNAFDALNSVRLEDCGVRVSYASKWQNKRSVKDMVKNYDWTYTPDNYQGIVSNTKNDGSLNEIKDLTGQYELPLDKLSKPDPILFYDDMVLYEDELGDNGISIVNVKIRVMDERLLLLCRFFLRVDDVLFRVYDTRVYIEFDEDLIIREYKEHELDYQSVLANYVGKKDPKLALRDSNLVVQHLTLKKKRTEQIKL